MSQSITVIGHIGPTQMTAMRSAAGHLRDVEVWYETVPFRLQVLTIGGYDYVDIVADSAPAETASEYFDNDDLPVDFRLQAPGMHFLRVYYNNDSLFRQIIPDLLRAADNGRESTWIDDDHGSVHRVRDYLQALAHSAFHH